MQEAFITIIVKCYSVESKIPVTKFSNIFNIVVSKAVLFGVERYMLNPYMVCHEFSTFPRKLSIYVKSYCIQTLFVFP